MNRFIEASGVTVVAVAVISAACTLRHELAHKAIFAYWGCQSKIGMDFSSMSAYTQAIGSCNPTDAMMLAHSINEAVWYNLSIPLLVICGLLFMVLLRIELNK